MNYDDLYLLRLIKKNTDDIAALESRFNSVVNIIGSSTASIIFRDAPTLPVEPNPPSVDVPTFLNFRNGSPSKLWDPTNGVWI